MKKISSLVLAALMLMTLIPTGIAFAGTEAPEPYFQLGFTGIEGQAAMASDLKGNATSVTAGTNSATSAPNDAPILRKDSTNNVNYLEFGTLGAGNARVNGRASIKVLFPDTRILSGATGTPAAGQIGDYTVEMWANLTSTAQWGAIFGFWNDGFNDQENDFRLQTNFKGSSSKRFGGAMDGVDFSPAVAGSGYLNAWKHYAVTRTYDSQANTITLSLYIDGEFKGSNTMTPNSSSYNSAYKGLIIGNNNGERAMTGGIAAFNVYTSALSAAQIDAKYDASVGTYYPGTGGDNAGGDNTGDDNTGDDNTGDDNTGDEPTDQIAPYFELGFTGIVDGAVMASDLKGNATSVTAGTNNSTSGATHTPILRTDSTIGVNYLEFGSNGEGNARANGYSSIKVLFPDTRILSGTSGAPAAGQIGDYTAEFWANLKTTPNWGAIFGFWNDGFNDQENDFRLQTNFKGSSSKRFGGSMDGVEFSPAAVASDYLDKWAHYTVTRKYDSEANTITLSLYIDGTYIGSNTQTANKSIAYANVHKGLIIGNNNGERAMTGGLATFKVYTSSLTAEQIAAKYDASVATYYPNGVGGDDNTGDDNTGDDNTGDDNTGDDNTGDDNTGDDNTGDDNTGDEPTDPMAPYFELGFSKTGNTVTVKDLQNSGATVVMESTSNGTSADANGNVYKDHRPIYSEGPAGNFDYLQFSSLKAGAKGAADDRINGHARVLVTFPDASVLSGTTGTATATDIAEGLTVETWAKASAVTSNDHHWSGLFAFGSNIGGAADGETDIQFRNAVGSFSAYNAKRKSGSTTLRTYANSAEYMDKWSHYVYTREYDATTKTFTTTLYIDGVKVGSSDLDKSTNDLVYSNTFNQLTIGGAGGDKAGYGRSFIGGIATFKVYKRALSEEQVLSAFNDSYETYKAFKPVCDGVYTDEDGNQKIDVKIVGSVDHTTVAALDGDGKFKNDIGSVVVKIGGKEVRTEMTNYNKATQTATIKFIDNIGYNEEILIELPNVADADIEGRTLAGEVIKVTSPAAPEGVIFATGEPTITNNGTKVDMALEIQNAGDKTFNFDLVVRDASGAFKAMKKGTQNGANLTVSTNGISLVSGDTITAIAWYLDETKGAIAASAPISLIWE